MSNFGLGNSRGKFVPWTAQRDVTIMVAHIATSKLLIVANGN